MILLLVAAAEATIVVDLPEAQALLARPGVTVLDVRGAGPYVMGHIPGAVRGDAPVLVVGAWAKGWGEEGRLAWDLAYLLHGGRTCRVGLGAPDRCRVRSRHELRRILVGMVGAVPGRMNARPERRRSVRR